MAKKSGNPQIEDGYAKIANELAEAFAAYPFTSIQHQIIWAVLRQTYGYNRKFHAISIGFLVKATGRSRSKVAKAVSDLIKANVLIEYSSGEGCASRVLGINKLYKTWGVPQEGYTPDGVQGCTLTWVQGVPQEGYSSVPRAGYQIKKKENIKENKESNSFSSSDDGWDDWDNFGEEVKYEPL